MVNEFLWEVSAFRSDSKSFFHLFAVAVAGPLILRASLLLDYVILRDFLLVRNRFSSLDKDLPSLSADSYSVNDYLGGPANVRLFFYWLWFSAA